ncbi:unnamed protein product [Phytophthora fragariaefolia]|uniref:Unnamed protein product n=1 Tax=Phytophthora fragariaefolia TaxID=1490495 RepID=A0A9W6XKK9_9STRA|nr:unnamed protein product [Phytophthora fragariaefolia]
MEIDDYYDGEIHDAAGDGEIDAANDGEEIGAAGADHHVAALAQQFLLQTLVLAREHAVLQYQQEGQPRVQNAALMAVQASTETSVRLLTDQQRDIAVKLGEALTATQASLREQLQQLQRVQDERGQQIESYVSDRLAKALQDVQKETHD